MLKIRSYINQLLSLPLKNLNLGFRSPPYPYPPNPSKLQLFVFHCGPTMMIWTIPSARPIDNNVGKKIKLERSVIHKFENKLYTKCKVYVKNYVNCWVCTNCSCKLPMIDQANFFNICCSQREKMGCTIRITNPCPLWNRKNQLLVDNDIKVSWPLILWGTMYMW